MLHPLAMAGVAEHSGYREDPLGRLRRTASFVAATTFGTTAEAEAAIAQVHRVHRRVKGTAPDGRPYSAADPELVTFIHVAEVSSFLAASRRYGPRPLTPEQCDRYYEEVAPVALALGATWAPRSVAEVESYLLRVRPDLYAGPQAVAARDWLVRGVARRPAERAVYSLVLAAAVGVLPGWARRELGLSLAGPARPARRLGGGDAAHPGAVRRGALDGDPAGLSAPGSAAQVARVSPPSTTTTCPVT